MTSNLAKAIPMLAVAIASQPAMATSSGECQIVQQSIAQRKAVITDKSVYVAVSAQDPIILKSKTPGKSAQKKLKEMFLQYCKEYSGYKTFQVEARGGSSEVLSCDGKANYVFVIKKNNIFVSELTTSDAAQRVEIPELDGSEDLFGEFK